MPVLAQVGGDAAENKNSEGKVLPARDEPFAHGLLLPRDLGITQLNGATGKFGSRRDPHLLRSIVTPLAIKPSQKCLCSAFMSLFAFERAGRRAPCRRNSPTRELTP
jgi:hypothetical protein